MIPNWHGRTWAHRFSDAWFYFRHPVLFWNEIYRPWRASHVGEIVFEM